MATKFTVSDLKYHVQETGSHFFDKETMKFFGDRMSNFGIRKLVVKSEYDQNGKHIKDAVEVEVWELYRKRPVKNGLCSSHYFSTTTFREVHPIMETEGA